VHISRPRPLAAVYSGPWILALAVVALLLGLVSLAGIFLYAPSDAIQGDVQRIFYIHVPMALCAYVATGLVAGGGILYLFSRRMYWDALARCSAECAVLFTSLVLVTGSLWGKPVWGTWWAWDARLTSTLMLWFILVAYLMLRSFIAEPERAARYSVVVGVLAALDIPLVHVSVEWWRTLHPQGILDSANGTPALPASMLAVFGISSLAVFCTFLVILALRFRLEMLYDRVGALEERVLLTFEGFEALSEVSPMENESRSAPAGNHPAGTAADAIEAG
jgi:heme exporter protein C